MNPLLITAITFLITARTASAQFSYISPVPGSKMHKKEAGIILRTGQYVDASSLTPDNFFISGLSSGPHDVKVRLAADNKTILIHPSTIFSAEETVTVSINDGIRNSDGSIVNGTTFEFQVSPDITEEELEKIKSTSIESGIDEYPDDNHSVSNNEGTLRTACDHLPPFIITSTSGAYYDEPIAYWNYAAPPTVSDCWDITIISSDGDSIFSDYNNDRGFDFKVNDNGYLTCFNRPDSSFFMFDSAYSLVKKIYMGNGYKANKRELRIYPDGTHFMICYDGQQVDMSAYGGMANAWVTGLVLQEIDANDDVIFEWRSWDHFEVTDVADDIPITASTIDYVHGNSIDLDVDGNILLSSRNLDEITKIDRTTGDIIWRMGGKKNQFTFINNPGTPKPFSHQHHFRLLPNGHYTMFDNGNYQTPQRSTAKEFVIDQVNKTATLVWSYVHPQVSGYEVYGSALGSHQPLPNGNHLINWGQVSYVEFADIPNFTEVDSNGNIVWEFRFVDSTFISYRALKFPWDRCNLVPDTSLSSDNVTAISADLHWQNNSKISGFILQYKECGALSWTSVPLDTSFYFLEGLQLNSCYDWRVQSICAMYGDSFSTPTHQFITLNPVSVNDQGIVESYFLLYPNPATNETELNFFNTLNCPVEVMIYDLLGSLKFQRVLFAQKGINKWRINLEFLTAGIYTVELKLSAGTQFRRLVIH